MTDKDGLRALVIRLRQLCNALCATPCPRQVAQQCDLHDAADTIASLLAQPETAIPDDVRLAAERITGKRAADGDRDDYHRDAAKCAEFALLHGQPVVSGLPVEPSEEAIKAAFRICVVGQDPADERDTVEWGCLTDALRAAYRVDRGAVPNQVRDVAGSSGVEPAVSGATEAASTSAPSGGDAPRTEPAKDEMPREVTLRGVCPSCGGGVKVRLNGEWACDHCGVSSANAVPVSPARSAERDTSRETD